MTSEEYWKKREEKQRQQDIKKDRDIEAEINKVYEQVIRESQKSINSFISKYATDEGISMAEARKVADTLDIQQYAQLAAQYCAAQDFSDQANKEMSAYNMTMKVNRLRLLEMELNAHMTVANDKVTKLVQKELRGQAQDVIEQQAGILGQTVLNNYKAVPTIVNASFHSATWSKRIWGNQQSVRSTISKALQSFLVQGKATNEARKALEKKVNSAYKNAAYAARRIVVTERQRVAGQMQMQIYKDAGVEWYKFIAEPGCCDACKALDGKKFKVEDAEAGVNMRPMHPNCRCSTAMTVGGTDADYDEWLDSFGEHGMPYDEWLAKKEAGEPIVSRSEQEEAALMAEMDFLESEMSEYFEWNKYVFPDGTAMLISDPNFKDEWEKQYQIEAARLKTYEEELALRPDSALAKLSVQKYQKSLKSLDDVMDFQYSAYETYMKQKSELYEKLRALKGADYLTEKDTRISLRKQYADADTQIAKLLKKKYKGLSGITYADRTTQQAYLESLQDDLNAKIAAAKAAGNKTALKEYRSQLNAIKNYLKDADTYEALNKTRSQAASKLDAMGAYYKKVGGVYPGEPMSVDDADTNRTNPRYGESKGYAINCQTCVIAYEARLRGYDVSPIANTGRNKCAQVAKNTIAGWQGGSYESIYGGKWYSRSNGTSKVDLRDQNYDYLENTVQQGQRYTIQFTWRDGKHAHIINLDRDDNGTLRFIDNQRGDKEKDKWIGEAEIKDYMRRWIWSDGTWDYCPRIIRTDDKDFNSYYTDDILTENKWR